MKKVTFAALAVICFLTLFSACGTSNEQTSESYALDTVCTQSVYGSRAADAVDAVNAMLWDVTNTMSIYEGSYIYEINAAAPDPVEVTGEVAALLQAALEIARETDGAFDPAIGAISTLWDISGTPRVPDAAEITEALALVDYTGVTVDGTSVSLQKSGMMIDLGGIAKGYAADLAAEIYEEYGVTSALLNLGGNIYVYGTKTDGGDYRIGLRDPFGGAGEYAAVVSVSDTSVVTSGVYERYFESGGETYHHIFDPETGYPADNGLVAVTVICASSTRADALSTAFFVMGLDKGLALANTMDDVEAVFFTSGRDIYVTGGLNESIEITNEAYTLQS
ncbi:MAG: FAD:protein FMN transferase [Eubacteriales bacterium]|nr:FAD:protein FMN transferase [Eubacteriales bacterium]